MIYYDNAATTPICAEARDALLKSFEPELFGNPSAPHGHGLAAGRLLKAARKELAAAAGCRPEELVFTSGGTESNNLAIFGAAKLFARTTLETRLAASPLILATNQEHPSVAEPLKQLRGCRVMFAPPEEWHNYIEEAAMICLPEAASETGDTFDGVVAKMRRVNPEIIVFVDGAQGFGKRVLPSTDANLYSFSGHKFHAPKGVGGLVVRGVRLFPAIHGGNQQPLRSGTENVPAIMAMAAAHRFTSTAEQNTAAVKDVIASIADELPDVTVNSRADSSPYILNMSFLGVKSETMVNLLSSKKLYAGLGTACNAKKAGQKPLHGLLGAARADSAVRFSFSVYNTPREAHIAKGMIIEVVQTLRR